MRYADIVKAYEHHFPGREFPHRSDVLMTGNDLYQFAHAIILFELERKLGECYSEKTGTISGLLPTSS